jgi:hypothetical protein
MLTYEASGLSSHTHALITPHKHTHTTHLFGRVEEAHTCRPYRAFKKNKEEKKRKERERKKHQSPVY